MPESGRAVLLEEEMTEPGEPVTAEQSADQEQRLAAQDRGSDQQQHPATADEMQPARHRVAVLVQIERIELTEAGETGHAHAPGAVVTVIMRLSGRESGLDG